MVIECKGILDFEVKNVTKKHERQSSWKKVAMILTNDDICQYYAWFLKKRFNLTLNKPIRGSHVTFINDRAKEVPDFDIISKKMNGKEISFYVEIEPRSNGEHWWLRVHCPDAELIRKLCDGKPSPEHSFHLTLGYANERNLKFSEYILRQCQRFELISSEPRKELSSHKIINL